ncbi:MAG: hypothetical protein ACKOWF_06630 [Chloroflexota bacterium]
MFGCGREGAPLRELMATGDGIRCSANLGTFEAARWAGAAPAPAGLAGAEPAPGDVLHAATGDGLAAGDPLPADAARVQGRQDRVRRALAAVSAMRRRWPAAPRWRARSG